MSKNTEKSMSGAMKFLKASLIGTMLVSVGGTYAFSGHYVAFAEGQTPTAVSQSDYASLTKSLSTYHYDDVRADNAAFSSIEWAAETNLFNDGGQGIFNPSHQVTESELVDVLTSYFNLPTGYEALAKYQVSLNGYTNTDLRDHNVKVGEWIQVVSELTGETRGDLDASIKFLNSKNILDVDTASTESLEDMAGSEILLTKSQLAVLMHKVDNNHLTLSNASKDLYETNKEKSFADTLNGFTPSHVVEVATGETDGTTGEVTPVSNANAAAKAKSKKIQEVIEYLEDEHPLKEGAKVSYYKHDDVKDYIKSGNVYEYYRFYWEGTNKYTGVGVKMHKASSYEKAMYSTSGNHKDSKAKLTTKQKKVISTLAKNKTYNKKFRYIAVYDKYGKTTKLHLVLKNKKTAFYNIQNGLDFMFDTGENIVLPISSKSVPLKVNVKRAHNLNILDHRRSYKQWNDAFYARSKEKNFLNYGFPNENMAIKIKK